LSTFAAKAIKIAGYQSFRFSAPGEPGFGDYGFVAVLAGVQHRRDRRADR